MKKLYALTRKLHLKVFAVLSIFIFCCCTILVAQTTINFGSSALLGESLSNPTSLQFGPDNRLYVSQQNGTILAYTIQKNGPNNYSVINTETITLIRSIPNHDDDGSLNTVINTRQVTGLLVVGTAANPIIYVCSSDPRIGGGGTAGDKNLDTNSGILSKLSWNGTSWVKIDLVKGLPRSEENHSSNGLTLDAASNTLYVASGGHTNAGSPSNNFAFITEYALSAAILKIDLSRIETEFGGSYTLPTLDDPTRANTGPNGSDANDPWGGNDGINQAKLVLNGPVQIHSSGYRNAYDLLITKTPGKEGRMYTIDNGANGGWGGYPDGEGTPNVTNKYVVGEPGSTTAGTNDAKVNNRDNLHLVSGPGLAPIYGGHPNPIRANPAGAGLYSFNNTTGIGTFSLSPTVDWPPVPVSMANPVESDYRNPGVNDGALYTWGSSTNGIAEYTSTSQFKGELTGDLLAASFDGNIYRIKLNSTGTSVVAVTVLAGGFGSQPLDVIAQGDNDIFPGTVWAATYGANSITIFEPVVPTDVWSDVAYSTSGITPPARHENGFVEANGKFYIIGGRVERNVNIFDPKTKVWTLGAASPVELNHFQAVVYNNEIYAIGAMSGSYPNEVPLSNIYKYNIQTNTWTIGASIPSTRRRGSAGVVLYNNRFYIIGGIQNGHIDGWVPWADEYDPATGIWTVLPDAPVARDHFMATLINGKIYAAGGRQTHYPDFAANTIASVDVYDVATKTWTSPTQIPTQRGAPGVAYIGGVLVIAGGEISSSSSALSVVEAYDPLTNTWQTKPSLNVGRHATQMISYQGILYLCAGSTTRGGNGQTNTMSSATYVLNCSGENNSFSLDDDGDGYSNGDETANGTDPCSGASKPEDFDVDGVSDLIDTDDDNDGLNDQLDKFALDSQNGITTGLPVDYPFLNGNPGFGLFGLGFTGLMTNNITDYQHNFDLSKPNLVMGGAVGIATAPAEAGDPTTNDQKYAFQFGVNVTQSTPPFTIQSKLLGSSFFDGASGTQLGTQSQGIYFGTGDQDNYMKLVVHANNANPGLQILIENAGVVTYSNIFPVSNILLASAIDVFFDINPATGVVQCKYQTNSAASPVSIGPALTMTGNMLTALQNNNAVAVGLIASAGNKAAFTASWDYLKIISSVTQTLTEVIRINAGGPAVQFGSELWKADQYFTGGSTFSTTNAISNTTNDALYQTERFGNITYNIPVPQIGQYTVELHFAELFFTTSGSRIFNVNVESGQFAVQNIDLFNNYGGQYAASVIRASNVQVNDGFLTITLTNVVNNAKISGIAVFRQTEETPVNRPPVVTKPANISLNIGQSWSYQVIASDPDAGAVLTYSATGLPGSLSVNANTGLISGSVSATAGTYTINLTVKDQQNLSASTSFIITVVGGGLIDVVRINSGGPSLQFGSEVWQADQYFTGGKTFSTTSAISNTTNDALYQTERYGNISYNIPVPQTGTYTVDLHFAEIFSTSSGSRIFNVDVEGGQFVLSNIDLFKDYGGRYAASVIQASDLQVNDGFLTITLTNVVDNAKISGIAVFRQSTASTNQAPVANAGPDKTITLPTSSVALSGSGSDPEDGTNVTYSWSQVSGPSTAAFSSTTQAGPTVSNLIAGTYIFGLIVKDSKLLGSPADQVSVIVNPAASSQQLVSFTLINASNEQEIQTLSSNSTLNLATLPSQSLNIRANTSPATVGSVVFALTGTQTRNQTETGAPYALFGDVSGNYNAWTPAVGSYTLKGTPYSSSGGGGTAGTPLTISFSVVNQANQPPVVTKPANVSVVTGQSFNYQVLASDPEGSTLSYSAVNLPAGLTINSGSGLISGTANAAAAAYTVTLTVKDQPGLTASTSFVITVSNPNQPPVITKPANASVVVGQSFNYQVLASDPEGSTLSYSASNLPAGLTINSGSGLISGTVNAAAAPYTVTLTVKDQPGLTASTSFVITVSNPNQPPVINKPANVSVMVGQSFNYQVVASDPEGSTLSYSASNLPAGLTINSGSGLISGTVNAAAAPYTVTLTVKDQPGLTASTSFVITVGSSNRPPVITKPQNVSLKVGQTFTYQVIASDPDANNVLTYSASNLPRSLVINSNTGFISGTVTGNPGNYTVSLTVADQLGSSASTSFIISIKKGGKPGTSQSATSIKSIDSIVVSELKLPITWENSLGLEINNFQGEILTVHPNPAQRHFSVTFNVKSISEWKFSMYNTLGRIIELPKANLEKGVRTVNFDLNSLNLNPGIYYLIMSNNLNEKKTAKIIIN